MEASDGAHRTPSTVTVRFEPPEAGTGSAVVEEEGGCQSTRGAPSLAGLLLAALGVLLRRRR